MGLFLESGYTALNKAGEELCGDRVESAVCGGFTTLVLADGMGSGVKANILSTLTSKILCTMVSNNVDIVDCVETVLQSLPVCKVRGVAYSTFSVIHVNTEGKGWLFEFDNPQAIRIHGGKTCDFEREEFTVLGKKVYKTVLALSVGDVIVVMSDGVIHAGVGMTLNFGWQRPEVKEYLDRIFAPDKSARCIAWELASACNDLYLDKPGDDTTVAAVKIREELNISLMVGPPVDKTRDGFCVSRFLSEGGKRVVCGGTSARIVAKHLGKTVGTAFDFPDREVPPIGFIDGIDLVTEGVLTLRRLLGLSERYVGASDLSPKRYGKKDGASLLADMLFEQATGVTFFVGQSINAAHQGLPIDTTMKLKLVEALAENLQKMGKKIAVNYD
ncbi:MAG: serine/threonine-protein phosphatase [Clostridiales bacterium]|jgi:hypothetical protein|nr:serine/threonine-protein phosphatase [Clostridiales bacterium]